MTEFNNFKKFITFIITGMEYDESWRFLFGLCKDRAMKLKLGGNAGEGKDELLELTSARLMAPVYEMYHLVDVVGVNSNDQVSHLENEMCRIVEEAVSRGLLNEACVPEEELRKFINISPEMGRLLWPKRTRELMDIRDALSSLVK